MPVLEVIANNENQDYTFDSFITIGRSSRCDVRIKDIKLSRVHMEIIRDEDDFILIDLRSQNGVKLNGSEISHAILKDNDEISIGRAKIVFRRNEQ